MSQERRQPRRALSLWLLVIPLAWSALAFARSALAPTLEAGWQAPIGSAERVDGTLRLIGEAGTERAVVVWTDLTLKADDVAYARIAHGRLPPRHQLSVFFRSDVGEGAVDLPRTVSGGTVRLRGTENWTGTIRELALVYGPEGNIVTLGPEAAVAVHDVALLPEGPWARLGAFWTNAWAYTSWRGTSINVLPRNGLVALAGVLVFVGLLAAALPAARPARGGRIALIAGLGLLAIAQLVPLARVHADERALIGSRLAAGRPPDVDWELAEFAAYLRTRLEPLRARSAVAIDIEDPYVAQRLRWHLLPLRSHVGPPAELQAFAASGRCIVAISPQQRRPLIAAETAFGPISAALVNDTGDRACSSRLAR